MRGSYCARYLNSYVERVTQFELSSGQALAQRLAFNVLGGDKVAAVYLTDLEDGDDVGVIEA